MNIQDNQKNLESIARTVRRANISKNFAPIFAECNSLDEQRKYVEELRQMCGKDGVVLTEVKLLEKPPIERLLQVVLDHLEKEFDDQLPDKLGIQVTGLELSILLDADEQAPAVLQILNMNRESYYKKLPFPFIFWLPEYAIIKVANAAPDFWSVQVGSATFSVDETPRDLLPESIESGKTLTVWQDKQAQIPLLERLLDTQTAPEVRVDLLIKSADAYYYIGKTDKAQQRYEQAIEENKKAKGKPQRVAEAYNKLGLIYSDLGTNREDLEKAEKSLQHYLGIVEQGDRTDLAAMGYNHLGLVYDKHNKYHQAFKAYRKAQDISRRYGHRKLESDVLGNMGLLYRKQKEYEDALNMHQQALTISREMNDTQGEALDLGNIGLIYFEQKEYEKAIDYYNQALLKNRHVGNKLEEMNQLILLGDAWKALEDFSKALESYQSARAIAENININIFTILKRQAALYEPGALGRADQKIILLKEAVEKSSQQRAAIEKNLQLEPIERKRLVEQTINRELPYWEKLCDIYRKQEEIPEKNNCLMRIEGLLEKQIHHLEDVEKIIGCYEKLSKIYKEHGKKKGLKICSQKLEELKHRQIIAWFDPDTVQMEEITPVMQVGKTYKLNMQIVQTLPKHPLIYKGKGPFFKKPQGLSNIEEQWLIEGRRTSSIEKAAAKKPQKEPGEVSRREIVRPKDNKGVKSKSFPGKGEYKISLNKGGKASKIQAPLPPPFNLDSFGTTVSFNFTSSKIRFQQSKIDLLLSERNISDVGIIAITPQSTGEDRISVKVRNKKLKYKNDFDIPFKVIWEIPFEKKQKAFLEAGAAQNEREVINILEKVIEFQPSVLTDIDFWITERLYQAYLLTEEFVRASNFAVTRLNLEQKFSTKAKSVQQLCEQLNESKVKFKRGAFTESLEILKKCGKNNHDYAGIIQDLYDRRIDHIIDKLLTEVREMESEGENNVRILAKYQEILKFEPHHRWAKEKYNFLLARFNRNVTETIKDAIRAKEDENVSSEEVDYLINRIYDMITIATEDQKTKLTSHIDSLTDKLHNVRFIEDKIIRVEAQLNEAMETGDFSSVGHDLNDIINIASYRNRAFSNIVKRVKNTKDRRTKCTNLAKEIEKAFKELDFLKIETLVDDLKRWDEDDEFSIWRNRPKFEDTYSHQKVSFDELKKWARTRRQNLETLKGWFLANRMNAKALEEEERKLREDTEYDFNYTRLAQGLQKLGRKYRSGAERLFTHPEPPRSQPVEQILKEAEELVRKWGETAQELESEAQEILANEEKVKELVNEAARMINDGKYAPAKIYVEQGLAISPTNKILQHYREVIKNTLT